MRARFVMMMIFMMSFNDSVQSERGYNKKSTSELGRRAFLLEVK
jgi:hypothetical protein